MASNEKDVICDVATAADPAADTVVLINGFMGKHYSLWPIYYFLKWHGFSNVIIFRYPSRELTIEIHGANLAATLEQMAKDSPNTKFHFICSSMGNLVFRAALIHEKMPQQAKVGLHIALGPPWRGAAWGRAVNSWAVARWISGDGPGKQLRETPLDGFDYLGHHPSSMKVLVIAGLSSYNIFISKPNDGTIALEETYLQTPHYRWHQNWGVHALLHWTPHVMYTCIQFLLGSIEGLEYHPGIMKDPPVQPQSTEGHKLKTD